MKRILLPVTAVVVVAVAFGMYFLNKNSKTNDSEVVDEHNLHADVAKQARQSPSLENIRAVVSGEYTRPQWSPDGSKLLLTKSGNQGLYYIDLASPEKIVQLNDVKGVGYGAAWSHDGREVFFNEKQNFTPTVKSISLQTKQISVHPDIHFSSIRSYTFTKGEGPVIQLNQMTLQVEAYDPQTSKSWTVTTDGGQFYDPLLSPDRLKVAVHRDAYILIYHADGSGLFSNLGKGIATSWSPDSKHLLAFLDESTDGHQVSNSDLYLLSADGSGKWSLTSTTDVIEMWPSWNPVKNQIAFADNGSGQIFVADILLNE